MNTDKYYRQMKWLTGFAILCSIFWIYWITARTIVTYMQIPVDEPEYILSRDIVMIGSNVSMAALIFLLLRFMVIQLKSLKNGVLFCKKGYRCMFTWATIWPVYDCCASSFELMVSRGKYDVIEVPGSAIGVTFIIITFAILYKIATEVAEENNLTI